jgi:hypothetical protein
VDIEIAGHYAYIGGESSGLLIVDVADSQNPVLVSIENSQGIEAICISGDYAYAGTLEGLAVFNISNKEFPQLVNTINLQQFVRGINFHDNLLFVAAVNMGLLTYNIQDPVNPQWLSTYQPGGNAEDVMYHNGYVYVANRYFGMYILDITDPAAPVEVGRTDTPRAAGILVNDDFAYIADTWFMSVLDITAPENPVIVGQLEVGDEIRGITVDMDHLYIANNYGGMNVLDISSKEQPVITDRYTESKEALDVVIKDGLGFIADGFFGLKIVNVVDPDTVFLIGELSIGEDIFRIANHGDYVYAAINQGFAILDIHDLGLPVLIGTRELGIQPEEIVVNDHLLFVCSGHEGMWIYDITDPTSPAELTKVETDSWIQDVSVVGNYALLAEGYSGLGVLDITNPSLPARLNSIELPGFAWSLIARGNYAYLSCRYEGLFILDIRDVSQIKTVATYGSKAEFLDVVLSKENIIVADQYDGVFILAFDSLAVSAPNTENNIPDELVLMAKPNPFTEKVVIDYKVIDPGDLRMVVYSACGDLIDVLIDSHHQPGVYTYTWNATQSGIPQGLYYLHVLKGKEDKAISLMYISQ